MEADGNHLDGGKGLRLEVSRGDQKVAGGAGNVTGSGRERKEKWKKEQEEKNINKYRITVQTMPHIEVNSYCTTGS